MLAQTAFQHRLRGQLLAQLHRRALQQAGHLGVLPAHRGPALLDAAVVLLPVAQGGEFLVYRRQKGREVQAPVGKILGKIRRFTPAPVQHGGGRVVEGVERGDIIPVPAPGLERTFFADAGSRPVKDHGDIVVVFGGLKRPLQRVVQGTKGPRRVPQPPPHSEGRTQVGDALSPGGQQEGEPLEALLGQGQKQGAARAGLKEQGQGKAVVPGPQRRPQHGSAAGQRRRDTASAPAAARRQTGQAIGHGVDRSAHSRQVQGQPNGYPRQRSGPRTAQPPRCPQAGRGQDAAQGDFLIEVQAGQRGQQRAQEDQQAHPALRGQQAVPAPGADGGEDHAEAPGAPDGQDDFGQEIDDVHRPPALLGQVHKAGAGVHCSRHQGHGPGAPQEFYVIKGEAHGEGQNRRRRVAQAVGEAQQGHIAEAGPGQRRRAA